MTEGSEPPTARFRVKLEQSGKTATGFVVPDDAVEALGNGKRPPVVVEINGHTYRNTVAVMGGRYMVGVSAENRAASGAAAGDEVDVTLTLDTRPREVTVPADLAAALAENPTAQAFFDTLSYSIKRWHVESIEGAKTAATRERRISKSVAMLAEHRKR
ncbi:YdeI/OmpD-associated family protein [Solicola gregarius]|uniref:YdeI/OmpD-associated family protein n=1 Tax=Solicola gregarius TaxID=2908642 RepID=A0AA46TG45_9ACTN|nr:YdeI/OmpD-associated family protein [Solicola gregarius]UYM04696.1 YdeI/OmpD-associated family protein [Solicola gregarius]